MKFYNLQFYKKNCINLFLIFIQEFKSDLSIISPKLEILQIFYIDISENN